MFKIFSQTLASSLIALSSLTASQAFAHVNPELALLPPKPIQMTEVSIPGAAETTPKLPISEIIKKDMRWKDECYKDFAANACYATISAAQRICMKLGMRLPTIRELLYFHAPAGVTIKACVDGQFSGIEVTGVEIGGAIDRVCYQSKYTATNIFGRRRTTSRSTIEIAPRANAK